jgi:hypothetical protein
MEASTTSSNFKLAALGTPLPTSVIIVCNPSRLGSGFLRTLEPGEIAVSAVGLLLAL